MICKPTKMMDTPQAIYDIDALIKSLQRSVEGTV